MEKQEQEQTQPNDPEQEQHPHAHEKQEELEKQQEQHPHEHEKQEELENPNSPPKLNSPSREQTNPSSPPKLSSPQRLPYQCHKSKPQYQSPPSDSPPQEQREQDDYKKPPPFNPPPVAAAVEYQYHNSKPQYRSPPSDSPPQELREQDDYKKPPPFNPPSIAAAVDSKEEPTSHEVNDVEHGRRGGGGDGHVDTGSGRRYLRANLSNLKRAQRDGMLKRALIVSRICGFVFSLVSFSVLAADRDRGWAVDSFYRYKELRYCMAVNVIVFVYSGFQGYDLVYQLTLGKHKLRQPLRYYLDFSVDQMLTYLLISASSSAGVRVDDWQSNWGKDEFPEMARASVALSFLAFVALALSSLISGYTLCTLKSI